FVESVKNCFGLTKYEDPRGDLSKLLHLGTIEDYQWEFKKLMNRVTDILDSFPTPSNGVEYVRAVYATPVEVVFLGPVDEVRAKLAEFFKDKGSVEKAADVERRKGVKCYVQGSERRKRVLCYVQGSGMWKRKKYVGCDSGKQDCAFMGVSVFALYNPGPGSFAQGRIWDPIIKSAFQDNTLKARWF
nr:hypothetical protein [Tanacetum cinerariifolium]